MKRKLSKAGGKALSVALAMATVLAQGFGSGKKTVEEYCRILYEFIQKSNDPIHI